MPENISSALIHRFKLTQNSNAIYMKIGLIIDESDDRGQ
jgi:hypothetical protein